MVYTKLDGEDLKEQIKDKFSFPLERKNMNSIIEEIETYHNNVRLSKKM